MKLKLNTIAYLFIISVIVAGCAENAEENQQKERLKASEKQELNP